MGYIQTTKYISNDYNNKLLVYDEKYKNELNVSSAQTNTLNLFYIRHECKPNTEFVSCSRKAHNKTLVTN